MGNTGAEKSLIERCFRALITYPQSGNAFMEMVTDKCTRTAFLPTGTRTWKAGLRYTAAQFTTPLQPP